MTKLIVLRFVVPVLVLLLLIRFTRRYEWLEKAKERVSFNVHFKRMMIALVLIVLLVAAADYALRKLFPDREELMIQRQGGRSGGMPPPVHGRRFE
ncbi:hypothetical protein [Desulfoglaeba alkanexedens]|uniref:Uncharacterized protein n=1 Tax=Desulfoglaeba alkanexedens ALDC TaxID=980445 RepID=A0A4P8L4T4_9BACT|nr:hypothetical protein [Desulfoglaeba alkanexedens]QCQ22743.1 hypothetical protein FDQ92_11500 [Desulfoglaeba alkanexedens ALDC]